VGVPAALTRPAKFIVRARRPDTLEGMWGAVILVIGMVFVLPIALFVAGALWSALVGWSLTADRPSDRSTAET
jgi:hypothetical protein